jgi:mannose-1-phosphate guanylyltransferase
MQRNLRKRPIKAIVLGAGKGTRVRPLTGQFPKPLTPVLDKPGMGHILQLLEDHGIRDVIVNVHYKGDMIMDYFGDGVKYSEEPTLLGTAGSVRNCRDFFDDSTILVIAGDALTNVDLTRMIERHDENRAKGALATIAVKEVTDTSQFGIVVHDEALRLLSFQEKPAPQDALSNLANTGIYLLEPEIFDWFPGKEVVDFGYEVFPAMLRGDVPIYVHPLTEAEDWSDVGTIEELRAAILAALGGRYGLELPGRLRAERLWIGDEVEIHPTAELGTDVWIGDGVAIAEDAQLIGRVAIGDGAMIGAGAQLRDAVVLPGAEVPAGHMVVGGIYGGPNTIGSMRSWRGISAA